jgi:hypothetical protein
MSVALLIIGVVAVVLGAVHAHQASIDRNRAHVIVGGAVSALGVLLAILGGIYAG